MDINCTSFVHTSKGVTKKYKMPGESGKLINAIKTMGSYVDFNLQSKDFDIVNEIVSHVQHSKGTGDRVPHSLEENIKKSVHNVKQIKKVQEQLLVLPSFEKKENIKQACVGSLARYESCQSEKKVKKPPIPQQNPRNTTTEESTISPSPDSRITRSAADQDQTSYTANPRPRSSSAKREMIAKDFFLYRGAKKTDKIAEIDADIDDRSALNLHERQSLAERLIFIKATNIHSINARPWPKTTYVVGSFGMVVTDRPHKKDGTHKRKFKTIPIQSEDLVITGASGTGHAEEALYTFLLEKPRVLALLAAFKQRYGISAFDHKVYGVVLDLHGTYDMCLSCAKKGLDFQNAFRELLLECFEENHLKALTSHPKLLPIVVRYSSDIQYNYPEETVDQYRGVLFMYKGKAKRKLSSTPNAYDANRDIKHCDPNLLVHGESNWHALWTSQQKRQQHLDRDLPLESWTAFTTSNTHSQLATLEAKHFNYTRLGLVETVAPSADPSVQAVQEDLAAVKINKP